MTGVRRTYFTHTFGCTFGNNRPSSVAAVGAEVDDIVGNFDDVEIVFDDDYGVALLDEAVENGNKFGNVMGVKSGCRLVEDIYGFAGGTTRQFGCKFDALRLTAAQGG